MARSSHRIARKDVSLPRWIIGVEPHRDDGETDLYILHLETPRFIGRWCIGQPPERKTMFVDGDDDNPLAIYDIVWGTTPPRSHALLATMREAVAAIDDWIARQGNWSHRRRRRSKILAERASS